MSSFVSEIAPIVQRLAPEYGIRCCSAIIAQAILESGWGKSELASRYHNYFGMKCGSKWTGASVNMSTKEEYAPGTLTDIRDSFRAYGSMEEGVRGYFEFIQLPRYQNLRGISDPRTYLQTIKDDGYATSSTYVDKCMELIGQNDLTRFDKGEAMAKMADIADRMRYWCTTANLGYDQSNRWDIRDGGECDCSSLVLWCVWEAGYMSAKPTWGNTASLWQILEPLGFRRVKASKSNPPKGVIRLRPGHVAVSMGDGTVAQASIDENGKITGGQGGDQTGRETNISKDPCNWEWDIYAPDAPIQGASQPSATNQPTGGKKVYGFPVVKRGVKGDAVRMLQACLNVRFGCGLSVDGSCGPATESAIRQVQGRLGLDQDGSCGPATWQAVLAA